MSVRDPIPASSAEPAPQGTTFSGQSVRGGLITFGGQAAKIVINIAGLLIMARLLEPQDFGLIAMVLPLILLVGLLQDLGLSAATVQRQEVTPAQSSNLFWLNVISSAALAAAIGLMAPAVAWFYGDPRLGWITIALSSLVLCAGLTSQHLALMARRMEFSRLARQDVAALFLGQVAGVTAACQGLAYWAIVIALAVRSVSQLVLVWLGAKWRPGRPSRKSGVRPMVRFGRDIMLNRLSNFVMENADSVMIGKVWGSYQLGIYDRAYSFLNLYKQVNGPVNSFANAVLSRLQHDPARFRRYYITGLGLVMSVSMPFMAFLVANAANVIRVGLGDKWLVALPVFLALAPAAIIGTTKPATWWIYTSLGRTDRQLKWSLYVQLPLSILAYATGLPFGPIGVAVAFSVVSVALRLPAIIFCVQDFKTYLRLRDVVHAILPAAFSALAAAGCQIILNLYLLHTSALRPVAAIGIDFIVYSFLYGCIYCALPVGRSNIAVYARIIGNTFELRAWTRRDGRPMGQNGNLE